MQRPLREAARLRAAARCVLRRCCGGGGGDVTDAFRGSLSGGAVPDDSLKESAGKYAAQKAKLAKLTEAGDPEVLNVLHGSATPKGTRDFFARLGLDAKLEGRLPWARELGSTGLQMSAVTFAAKRLSKPGAGVPAAAALKAGVNTFDFQVVDGSAGAALSALRDHCYSEGVSRSSMIFMVRVGWKIMAPYETVDIVAPDLRVLPKSADFASFSTSVSRPPGETQPMLELRNKSSSTADADAVGRAMMRRQKESLPGHEPLALSKMSDEAVLQLTGLARQSAKLGHFWGLDANMMQQDLEYFLRLGTDHIDVVIVDSVHLVRSIVGDDDEDAVLYLAKAFTTLEKMVANKQVTAYGVSSQFLFGGKSRSKQYLDPRLVLRAAQLAAQSIGRETHNLQVLGLPFNLTERDALLSPMSDDGSDEGKRTVFDFARRHRLAVVTTRPLATFDAQGKEQRYIAHTPLTDLKPFKTELPRVVSQLCGLEERVESLLAGVVMRPAPELYHIGRSFVVAQKDLDNYYQFKHFLELRFHRIFMECLKRIVDLDDPVLRRWCNEYRAVYLRFYELYKGYLDYMHSLRDKKILAAIDESTGGFPLGDDLAQKALNLVLATDAPTSVSVGLRELPYVASLVSRNRHILEKVPVSIIGGVFTNPETSFLLRRTDSKLVPTGKTPKEVEGMSEQEFADFRKAQATTAGMSGVVKDLDEEPDLPEVKVVGRD